MWRRGCTLLAAVLLLGCGQQELYARLDERQANEMVAVLRNAGIAAEKSVREGPSFAVTAPGGDFAHAVEVLHAGGYPRESYDTLGQVFRKEGFVSSPLEERARLMHALSQEIANTIASIDGVVLARVHLAVPEHDPLADKPRPASASVFVKHLPGVDLTGSVAQIKALVVNGVEGLPYDNVTVALFAAQPWPAPGAAAPTSSGEVFSWRMPFALLAALGALLAAAGGGLWWWQQRRPRAEAAPPVLRTVPAAGDGLGAGR